MEFGLATYAFGLLAGTLSTLSPCVLPIIPILLGSAVSVHPKAPMALAAGLAVSYAVVGSALAWAGGALGFDATVLRQVGAAVLGLFGILLMSGGLQQRFASATAGIGAAGNRLAAAISGGGLKGQFAIGIALGVVWSPCVGPTLGAAIVVAAQGDRLPQVALLMGLFGVGAALPIVLLGGVSRQAMSRVRGQLTHAAKTGKWVLGAALVAIAIMILSGADRPIQTWLVDRSPPWLTRLTTRF